MMMMNSSIIINNPFRVAVSFDRETSFGTYVSRWEYADVKSWLNGLDYVTNNVSCFDELNGEDLLSLDVDDLLTIAMNSDFRNKFRNALGMLQHLAFESENENLQRLISNVACFAKSFNNELKRYLNLLRHRKQILTIDFTRLKLLTKNFKKLSSKLDDVVHKLFFWLDRPPFIDDEFYRCFRKAIWAIWQDILEYNINTIESYDMNALTNLQLSCSQLCDVCNKIILENNDTLMLRPSRFDKCEISRKSEHEDIWITIDTTPDLCHFIKEINYQAQTDLCRKVDVGDEIVNINGQTIVGWSREKVLELATSICTPKILLLLRKLPRDYGGGHCVKSNTTTLKIKKNNATINSATLPNPKINMIKVLKNVVENVDGKKHAFESDFPASTPLDNRRRSSSFCSMEFYRIGNISSIAVPCRRSSIYNGRRWKSAKLPQNCISNNGHDVVTNDLNRRATVGDSSPTMKHHHPSQHVIRPFKALPDEIHLRKEINEKDSIEDDNFNQTIDNLQKHPMTTLNRTTPSCSSKSSLGLVDEVFEFDQHVKRSTNKNDDHNENQTQILNNTFHNVQQLTNDDFSFVTKINKSDTIQFIDDDSIDEDWIREKSELNDCLSPLPLKTPTELAVTSCSISHEKLNCGDGNKISDSSCPCSEPSSFRGYVDEYGSHSYPSTLPLVRKSPRMRAHLYFAAKSIDDANNNCPSLDVRLFCSSSNDSSCSYSLASSNTNYDYHHHHHHHHKKSWLSLPKFLKSFAGKKNVVVQNRQDINNVDVNVNSNDNNNTADNSSTNGRLTFDSYSSNFVSTAKNRRFNFRRSDFQSSFQNYDFFAANDPSLSGLFNDLLSMYKSYPLHSNLNFYADWLYRRRLPFNVDDQKWNLRWVVLVNDVLCLFENSVDFDKMEGIVSLRNCQVSPVVRRSLTSKKNVFRITCNGLTFYFHCHDSKNMNNWLNKLGLAAIGYGCVSIISGHEGFYFPIKKQTSVVD